MSITKKRLKQIINEEISGLLEGGALGHQDAPPPAVSGQDASKTAVAKAYENMMTRARTHMDLFKERASDIEKRQYLTLIADYLGINIKSDVSRLGGEQAASAKRRAKMAAKTARTTAGE